MNFIIKIIADLYLGNAGYPGQARHRDGQAHGGGGCQEVRLRGQLPQQSNHKESSSNIHCIHICLIFRVILLLNRIFKQESK